MRNSSCSEIQGDELGRRGGESFRDLRGNGLHSVESERLEKDERSNLYFEAHIMHGPLAP